MKSAMVFPVVLLLAACAIRSSAKCYDPSPAFPVPSWGQQTSDGLRSAFDDIQETLDDLISASKYDESSFSISVTSGQKTLFDASHTARKPNIHRPSANPVNASSVYRIASISKVFTTLALLHQHDAGNLSIEHPVSRYIEEFARPDSGAMPWKDTTLRILASQLSGVPREFALSDLIDNEKDIAALGLPPAPTNNKLPACEPYVQGVPCNRTHFIDRLRSFEPVVAPNQKSMYSNVNFDILGLVLANVTGVPYEDYIESAIFRPLGLHSASFAPPADHHAVIPTEDKFWDYEFGIQNPTGGIYMSNADLTTFVRYILTHYNTLATGVNWFMPASWSTTLNSFYGMPFEIFRTTTILQTSRRPVTFTTKAGDMPGYHSKILMLEEYGLGITILISGADDLMNKFTEIITVRLVRAAEALLWRSMATKYARSCVPEDPALNSSLTLAVSPAKGLHVTSFVSNGTDVLSALLAPGLMSALPFGTGSSHLQLVPTLLYKDSDNQEGEIYRALVVPERNQDAEETVWDDFCLTDVDLVTYAGVPVNEVVFWHGKGLVEFPAWQLNLSFVGAADDHQAQFVVQ